MPLILFLPYGTQTFFGPASEAVKYFAQPGIGWQMAEGRNPADFLLEASAVRQGICIDYPTRSLPLT